MSCNRSSCLKSIKDITKTIRYSRFLIWLIGYILFLYTLLIRQTSNEATISQDALNKLREHGGFVFIWHEAIHMNMSLITIHAQIEAPVLLLSGHSDGRYLAKAASLFDVETILVNKDKPASTIRQVYKAMKAKKVICIAGDGPRGPRRKLNERSSRLVFRNDFPIMCLGFASTKVKRIEKSWDNHHVMLPFTKTICVCKEINIDHHSKQDFAVFHQFLEDQINATQINAEHAITALSNGKDISPS